MPEPKKSSPVNFKSMFPKAMEKEEANQIWSELGRSLSAVYNQESNASLSFEELYRHAYILIINKHADMLFKGYIELVKGHLLGKPLDSVVQGISGSFMESLRYVWADFKTSGRLVRDVLLYYDRSPNVVTKKTSSIYHEALKIFREEIIEHRAVNDHLKASLLNLAALARRNEIVEWIDMKSACEMLLELSLGNRIYYEQQFEEAFLHETSDFYQILGLELIAKNSAANYVAMVNKALAEEAERAARFVDKTTIDKIEAVMNDNLVSRHMCTLLEMDSGLVFMMENNQISEMRSLYELLKRVSGGLEKMTAALSVHLREKGLAIVKNSVASVSGVVTMKPMDFVQNLLNLKAQFDQFTGEAFHSDPLFRKQVQDDFEYFLNTNAKSPECLSLYIDDKLKKGAKMVNEGEVEVALDQAMILFKSLREKDMFEKYYKQHLARRLLTNKGGSDDAEKSMITKLKTECGYLYTSKLEGMLRDIELSTSLMEGFKQKYNQEETLSVRVLTTVFWPTSSQAVQCNLPTALENSFNLFRSFYVEKHNGRKVNLNYALGNADVSALFYAVVGGPGEQKFLNVNTHQMIILLCFNDLPTITFQHLHEMTNIPEKDITRCLLSLSMGKLSQRILTREGTGANIGPSDKFSVNDNFTSKFKRVKVMLVTSRDEAEAETKDTREAVDEDRRHEVDAAVVRVMKSRKVLGHNDLFTEVSGQLKARFLLDPMLLKRRVESLIERDFLKRDEENNKLFKYLY